MNKYILLGAGVLCSFGVFFFIYKGFSRMHDTIVDLELQIVQLKTATEKLENNIQTLKAMQEIDKQTLQEFKAAAETSRKATEQVQIDLQDKLKEITDAHERSMIRAEALHKLQCELYPEIYTCPSE